MRASVLTRQQRRQRGPSSAHTLIGGGQRRKVGAQARFRNPAIVANDGVDLGEPETGVGQAPAGGARRETRVVLLACKALLLRRHDDLAVAQQRRGAVMAVGRDAENTDAHSRSLMGATMLCRDELRRVAQEAISQ